MHLFIVAARCLRYCMWSLVPRPRIELRPLHWEYGDLGTGPPGKSQIANLYYYV